MDNFSSLKMSSDKLIIFFPRAQTIAGGHVLFLGWAKYIADNNLRNVYFIYSSKPNMNMVKRYYSQKATYIDYEDAQVDKKSLFEGAQVFTPINYTTILLSYMPKDVNCKVMLYIGNPLEKHWFENNLSYKQTKNTQALAECYQIFNQTNALSYMDSSCYMEVTGEPAPDVFDFYAPVFAQPAEKEYLPRDFLHDNRVSIAWLGRLDEDKIHSLINTIENLYACETNGRMIDLHIIGDGRAKWRINLAKYAPKIRFVFTSYLYGENLFTYLSENVDVAVAMGISALDVARLNIPVLLPIVSKERFIGDVYTYLFDTIDYTLGITMAFTKLTCIKTHRLQDVLMSIYEDNQKKVLGARCREYAHSKFSVMNSSRLFLHAIDQSMLSGKQLASISLLHDEMQEYEQYCRISHNCTIFNYIDYNHQRHQAAQRDMIHNMLFFPKKALKTLAHHVKECLKRYRNLHTYKTVRKHYNRALVSIRDTLRQNGKLKVGFFVSLASTFTCRPIFECMLQSDVFDPYIIVLADVSRSIAFRRNQFQITYDELYNAYSSRVIAGYDIITDTTQELEHNYSIVFFANPYAHQVANSYRIRAFWDKPVLLLYAYYGFGATTHGRTVMKTDMYNGVWKLLLDTQLSLDDLKIHQPVRGRNGLVTGYVKMDEMHNIPIRPRARKRILLCPHHTVMPVGDFQISNFLAYAQQLLDLAVLYPDIDFVFRPHPMLFDNLSHHGIWTDDEIKIYLQTIEDLPNIEYSTEGNYMDLFVNSDAMIHDCSSFIGEYLFTENPCCYLYRPDNVPETVYTPLGLNCLNNYYPAHNWQDVINFIDRVVISQEDPLKENRTAFVRKNLKMNYPNSAQNIVAIIEDAVGSKKTR